MASIFKIHPAIGVSRLGDSTTDFCLAPEAPAGLPIKCDKQGRAVLDAQGKEQPIDTFKDSQGRIKRQAARFYMYVYENPQDKIGRELTIGDHVKVYKWQTGQVYTAAVLDIEWTVYLANKKASWYQFKELDGTPAGNTDRPLRNAAITDATARQGLIIDPGPQSVSYSHAAPRYAEFAKGKNPACPQSFPPVLTPNNVETLGEVMVHQQDGHNRLVVLGGHGRSGAFKAGLSRSQAGTRANNDGWFDDVSDGPVTAHIWVQPLNESGEPETHMLPLRLPVDEPAWVLAAYPGYVPKIENMITLDDVVYDLALREMDYNPDVYGPLASDDTLQSSSKNRFTVQKKGWNKEYHPSFYRDIWPILCRPNVYQWIMAFDPINSSELHSSRDNLDLDMIAVPPCKSQNPAQQEANAIQRRYILSILRNPQQNLLRASAISQTNFQPPLIPQLFGERSLENNAPSGFLHLTETQLFFLEQWADGKFVNEKLEKQVGAQPASGSDLDRNVLGNTLGGAFCPSGEVCWMIGNPAIYAKPYRIKHAPYKPGSLSQPAVVKGAETVSNLRLGLEPGDLTKYSTLPWQADFSECANQDIDITYDGWANSDLGTGVPLLTDIEKGVFWWAAHRPLEVFLPMRDISNPEVITHRARQAKVGDLETVTAWVALGFIHNVGSFESPQLVETEGPDGADNRLAVSGA